MSELTVQIVEDVGQVNLRGDPQDVTFTKVVQDVLGQALPIEANTISKDKHCICWLGPDEWLLVTASKEAPELTARLQDSLAAQHAAVNDLSGGQVVLRLSGESVRKLFAKGCTLDFHPDVFRTNTCAQSGLAKANALFVYSEEPNTFDVIVRRSFSDYLIRWMQKAGDDLGIEFR